VRKREHVLTRQLLTATILACTDATWSSLWTICRRVAFPAGPTISLTRRRLALLVAGLFALWLVVSSPSGRGGRIGRQPGRPDEGTERGNGERRRFAGEGNPANSTAWICVQVARGYLIGTPAEIPFTVDPNAPPLPAAAPGSVGIKPDAPVLNSSPLDSWLRVLFGTGQ